MFEVRGREVRPPLKGQLILDFEMINENWIRCARSVVTFALVQPRRQQSMVRNINLNVKMSLPLSIPRSCLVSRPTPRSIAVKTSPLFIAVPIVTVTVAFPVTMLAWFRFAQ